MNALTFPSWQFPGVPASARIVYARGEANVGAAGLGGAPFSVILDGEGEGSPFGDTGVMFHKRSFSGSGMKARLIGLGVGVVGYQRTLSLGGSLGAASVLDLLANLLVDSKGGALPAQIAANPVAFDSVEMSANQTFYLRIGGVDRGVYGSTKGGMTLGRVMIDQSWQIVNWTGSASLHGVLASHSTNNPGLGFEWDLVKRPVDSNGVPLVGEYQRVLNRACDVRAPQLLREGQRPELRPVDVGNDMTSLLDNEGFSIGFEKSAVSELPDYARIVSEMAIAVWKD